MSQELSTLVTAPELRLRHEYFGALAWRTDPRRIWRLDPTGTAVTLMHDQPRSTVPTQAPTDALTVLGLDAGTWNTTVDDLVDQGVIVATDLAARPITAADVQAVATRVATHTPTVAALKPLWVHIQPFTRCNQHCIHCYCSGGPKADPFLLDVDAWLGIVAKLDDYGVLDVYVT